MDQFVFVICQNGAEKPLKQQLLASQSEYRLAFSRPGLLTLKWNRPDLPAEIPSGVLVRLAGKGIGPARGDQASECFSQAWSMAEAYRAKNAIPNWDAIHVIQRDPALPGTNEFEPGESELADAVAEFIRVRIAEMGLAIPVNAPAEHGQNVLDLVLSEPNQWLVGHHEVHFNHERWPGGSPTIACPDEIVSRAYLKIAEAIAWSGLPLAVGDKIVEIGSAPGGACQRLLDLGLEVTGIDAAEMDERIAANPRFEHWRAKAAAVKRKMYRKFKWLACDANVAPNYTLDVVEEIAQHPDCHLQGMLLTLKLSAWEQLDDLEQIFGRIQSWGFPHVAARQLAHNRREFCVAVSKQPLHLSPRPNARLQA